MDLPKLQTADGSFSAYSEKYNESYHSLSCGALNESLKKHVIPAFDILCKDKKELKILDVCFGLGYNTLASIFYAKKHYPKLKLKIFSPELDRELIASLPKFCYPKELEAKEIIEAISKNGKYSDDRCEIELFLADAREAVMAPPFKFDAVFQDAFSPKKNRELWSFEFFENIVKNLENRAIITTYSQATSVKVAFHMLGLDIYEISQNGVRDSIVASNFKLHNLKKIDMIEKLKNAPHAKAIFDGDFYAKKRQDSKV